MSDLLPPFHKVMSDSLECHLANDRVALLEMENKRLNSTLLSIAGELLIVGVQSGYFIPCKEMTTTAILIAEHSPCGDGYDG